MMDSLQKVKSYGTLLLVTVFTAISPVSTEIPENWKAGVENAPCSKILIVAPISTASHIFVYAAFAEGLAARCHTVELLVSYESKGHKHPNMKQISSPTFRRISDDLFFFKVNEMPPYHWLPGTLVTGWYMSKSPALCEELLKDAIFKEYLDKPDDYYDMVFISPHLVDDCAMAFAHKARRANKPWGHLFSSLTVPWVAYAFGNPGLATYRPLFMSTWKNPMTFGQQVASQLTLDLVIKFRHLYAYRYVRQVLAEQWDPTIPDLYELEKTSAISLTNEDSRLFNYQEPRVADLICIGGVHVKPPKELPQHLDEWADSATDGFILFALGSALKSENFPEEARKQFLEAFKQLPNIKFLWKWDNSTMDGQPSNVYLEKWLPQQDILGHKNIKGFITHGGMLSTQEATYNGVPVIGIPIAAEQHINMARVTDVDGAGEVLSWSDLSVEKISYAIKRILEDKSILESVKRRQRMFKDQPETPLERGIFWTEYVLRNGYDTGLRSPTRDMSWLDMYAIYVWLLVAFVVLTWAVISTWVSWIILKRISRKLSSSSTSNVKKVKPRGKPRVKKD